MGAPPLSPVRCIPTLAAATTGADLAAASPSHSHQTPVPVCATGADPHTFSEPNSHHPLGGASSPPAGPTALPTPVQLPMGSVPQINRVPCSQPDATGGEPSELAHQFSPQSLDSLLHHVQYVASVWPAYGDLRSAASGERTGCRRGDLAAAAAAGAMARRGEATGDLLVPRCCCCCRC